MKLQYGLKEMLFAGLFLAAMAAIVAAVVRRLEFSSDGYLTVETEPGTYVSLVGVEVTPAGRTAIMVLLAAVVALGVALLFRLKRRSERR